MSEPDEHVLARTLQALSVVLDEPDETVNIIVFFEVNGQYVARGRLSSVTVSPSKQRSPLKVKQSGTYNKTPQYYRTVSHYERLRMFVRARFFRIAIAALEALETSLFSQV